MREPSNLTHVALEAAKTAVAVALEILDTEIRWLATVIGLKLKASYASTGLKSALGESETRRERVPYVVSGIEFFVQLIEV